MYSSIIKEISKKGIDTYFKKRQYDAMFWPLFFALKNVMSLTYTTLIGEQNGMVAADVIAYDASSPLKTRQVVSKLSGDIPKIAVKRKMYETDMLEYMQLSRMADADQKQVLDLIYGDIDFVVSAVNARLEWLALQAVSTTKIILQADNNGGIVTETAVDFSMPTANKSGASVAWGSANAATMKPITDFKAIAKKARDKGLKLEYALMHPNRYDDFIMADETIKYLKAFYKFEASDTLPFDNIEGINRALANAQLPQIRVIDQSIGIENKKGLITYGNPWDENYITFVPNFQLGNMLNGPVAEELNPPKDVIQSKSGNVLVTKYSEVDPVAEFTKGECNAFPSWKNIDKCFSLKATATSWS